MSSPDDRGGVARRARPSARTIAARLARVPRLVAILVALLLAAPAAHAFERPAQAAPGPGDLVLDSAGVPAASDWVVLQAVGTAAWRAAGEKEWRQFTAGEVLPAGCEVETGADGEVTLVAGGDQLIVAPYGRLIVPEADDDYDRRLRHERGRIVVHIEPRSDRKVRVDTPLLSLGIKGTDFEVEVGTGEDRVIVHEGEVEVRTRERPDPVALGAGQGLRQSATPGSPPTEFAAPDGDTPSPALTAPDPARSGATGGVDDRAATARAVAPGDAADDGTAAGARAAGDLRGPPRPRAPADRADAPPAARARSDGALGWVDDWASSWAWVAVAGVALVLLTIPVLALVQNLREQRLSQAKAEGRRRRELVRG